MDKTKIDWCDSTWNPVTGCLHGCEYCYARNIANRFGGWTDSDGDTWHDEFFPNDSKIRELDKPLSIARGEKAGKYPKAPYPYDFIPTLHRYRLDAYKNKESRRIFICSMADLFGAWVPDDWIAEVFRACASAPQHTYLFLTKNPERYYQLEDNGDLPDHKNMWYGITATNKAELERAVRAAGNLGCTVRNFLSIEPLHEDIAQSEYWDTEKLWHFFDWFIVGAETGWRAGKITPERKWIENIVESCRDMGKPVFLKSGRGIMEEIWGEPLIQEYPAKMKVKGV